MKEYKIKFKPTGIIFSLPETEIRRIWANDHGFNYEMVDKLDLPKEEKVKETTVFNQVVEEETETVKGFEDYSSEELKQFCEANGLKKSGNKADLLERVLEFTKQQAEQQEKDNAEVDELLEQVVGE